MDSERPTRCPTKVVKEATIDMGLNETVGSSVAPNHLRKVSNTPLSQPDSPCLKDLDELMRQTLMDLAATLDDEQPIGDTFESLSLLDLYLLMVNAILTSSMPFLWVWLGSRFMR